MAGDKFDQLYNALKANGAVSFTFAPRNQVRIFG